MKNILIIACVLFFAGSAYSQNVNEMDQVFKGDQISVLSDNDLGEALSLGQIVIATGEMHEAFRENPAVLSEAVKKNQYIAANFREYVLTEDMTTRRSIEELLLELYN